MGASTSVCCRNGYSSGVLNWARYPCTVTIPPCSLLLHAVFYAAGPLMSVAVIFADLQSLYWYIYAFASRQTTRLTGNHM